MTVTAKTNIDTQWDTERTVAVFDASLQVAHAHSASSTDESLSTN